MNSDGTLAAGTTQYLKGNPAYPSTFPTCGLDDSTNPNAGNQATGLAIDSSGKFLFVSLAASSATYTTNLDTTPAPTTATLASPGVAVYAIGANASLSEVAGSPFALYPASTPPPSPPSASALAVTHTVFPAQFAFCSQAAPPTSENLYVTDSVNNTVLNFQVSSSGSLTLVPAPTSTGVLTGTLPLGVAVDPCNRFVYTANYNSNNVSAYAVCNVVSQNCQQADYSLQAITGSPFAVSPGNGPGPLAVNPFGTSLYVVDAGSSNLSMFRISPADGALLALAGSPVSTNRGPNSIAIRSDNTFLFVANSDSATVSQFAITPASGTLTPQTGITTDNFPTGVAVK